MNIDNAFPSKYLKADDIDPHNDLILTISDVSMQGIGQGDQQDVRPVVSFEETEKMFVLNKTNASTIKGLFGPETDTWAGKKIALFAQEVDFQGRQVLAIRVRMRAPGTNGNGSNPNTQPSDAQWGRWFEMVPDLEAAGIEIIEPPENVTAAGLTRIIASYEAKLKKAAQH